MRTLWQPVAAVMVPFVAVVSAAALLLLVACSIALQPPETSHASLVETVLAWARAALFSAGAAAFLVSIVAFARVDQAGVVGENPEVVGFAAGALRPVATDNGPVVRQRVPPPDTALHDGPPPYIVIAVGPDGLEARAIQEYDDAKALSTALRSWSDQHPDEDIHVFDAAGHQISVHPSPISDAPRETTGRRPWSRRGVAVGGIG